MTGASGTAATGAPPARQILRRLFLTLFLRGRRSRAPSAARAPRSIARKLWGTLATCALLGLTAATLYRQPLFALSAYLHAITFLFVGMFVSASAGEVLFNPEEADILLHRPVTVRALLWGKVAMLLQVSVWMALAVNAAGFVVGVIGPQGSWIFIPIHIFSILVDALFVAASVVVTYQLCLRWFGRERLDNLMTTVQVIVSIVAVVASQLVPQFIDRFGGTLGFAAVPVWVRLLPPAWFAGVDDAVAGSRAPGSWWLVATALGATALIVWLAFGKLAADYETGLRILNEQVSRTPRRSRPRLVGRLAKSPPFSWWLGDPAVRASFLLTTAYLLRDRDTKLRVYPGIASLLAMPFLLLAGKHPPGTYNIFATVFAGVYLGLVPMTVMTLVSFSQHWQAADVFRIVPLRGPGPLSHGARLAVLTVFAIPMVLLSGVAAAFMADRPGQLALLLPGILALPVFAMVACRRAGTIPFSQPPDTSRSPQRGTAMFLMAIIAAAWAGVIAFGWTHGFFWWLMLAQLVGSAIVYTIMHRRVTRAPWPAAD